MSSPSTVTSARGSPISSSASRSAVSQQVGVLGVAAAARERDLPGVTAQVGAPPREDGVRLLVGVEKQRHEHRCGYLVGKLGQEVSAQALGRVCRAGTRTTCSSNMTSPSSVRCTGHLAAITRSRSTCSSGRSSGRRRLRSNLRRTAAFGRRVLDVDLDVADVPALAGGVHLHRDRGTRRQTGGEQLLWVRAGVLAAGREPLVDREPVVAHLDGVPESSLVALRCGFHRRVLPFRSRLSISPVCDPSPPENGSCVGAPAKGLLCRRGQTAPGVTAD